VKIRPLLPTPKKGDIPTFLTKDADKSIQEAKLFIPDLKMHFKFSDEEIKAAAKPDARRAFKWIGGEKAALERLQ